MRNNLRKILVNFFVFPITLLGLFFYICFLINPDIFLKPVLAKTARASQNENIYCQENPKNKILPEFQKAIQLADEIFSDLEINSDFQELAKCVEINYAKPEDKFSENKIQGKFETSKNDPDLKISIDDSYQKKDPLFLSLVLVHELTHVRQYFNYQKNWELKSCLDREAEAFQAEVMFFTALKSEEKDLLIDKIKKGPQSDAISKSLEHLMKIATESIIFCKNESPNELFNCFEKNNLKAIKKSLVLNKNYISQCKL